MQRIPEFLMTASPSLIDVTYWFAIWNESEPPDSFPKTNVGHSVVKSYWSKLCQAETYRALQCNKMNFAFYICSHEIKSSREILVCQLSVHHFWRCHGKNQILLSLAKNQLFWDISVFLPVFFIKLQKFINLYTSRAFWPDFVLIYVIFWLF